MVILSNITVPFFASSLVLLPTIIPFLILPPINIRVTLAGRVTVAPLRS
jgi:hypothetical protein